MLTINHGLKPKFTRKRTRSLSDHIDYSREILSRKRTKRSTASTSPRNGSSSNQREVASVPQPGRTYVEEYLTRKRPIESDREGRRKRRRTHILEELPASVASWVEHLPASPKEFENMNRSPSKRPRARSESSERDLQSESETDSTVTRSKKYSTYEDPRYPAVLESKNSFMHDSEQGPLPEEVELCKILLTRSQPLPKDPAFELLSQFLKLLQNRSELQVCILLHSRLVPPAEYLSLFEPQKFGGLIDGYNESWNKAIAFYKRLPQPDHTVAYRDSVLTDQQHRKLDIFPEVSSFYAGREGTCFPFFTCEVKCGNQALDVADMANINSMTISLRGVVELYRSVGRVMDIHRRILGFSISHDGKSVRIYGHYPEIDGERTSYYRHRIRGFEIEENNGEQKWTTYTFVYNLYTKFAPDHIKRIKEAVDLLPDPLAQSFGSDTLLNDSQGTSISQEFAKPQLPQGRVTNAQLKQQMQQLLAQLQQQRKDFEQQRRDLMTQLEQQRKESEQQRKESEQQRKESEQQQRKESEQQRRDLMAQLEQQRKESEQQRKELMAQLEQQRKELEQGRKELLHMLKNRMSN